MMTAIIDSFLIIIKFTIYIYFIFNSINFHYAIKRIYIK